MFIGRLLIQDDPGDADFVHKITLVDAKSFGDAMHILKDQARSYLKDFSQGDLCRIIVQINVRDFNISQGDLIDLSDDGLPYVPYPGSDRDFFDHLNNGTNLDQW